MNSPTPAYVGFGMLTPVTIIIRAMDHAIGLGLPVFLNNDWDLETSLRFATAAASLKVTRAGLQMFSIEEIKRLASTLAVKHPAYDNE